MTAHALNETKRHDFRLDAYGAFYSPTYAGSRSRVLDAEAESGATVESPVTLGLRCQQLRGTSGREEDPRARLDTAVDREASRGSSTEMPRDTDCVGKRER